MYVKSAILRDQIKMAYVVITFKVMPESPDVDLDSLSQKIKKMLNDFGAEVGKVEIEEVAFGLKALKFICVMNEDLGSTESVEKDIEKLEGVSSIDVVDVRRAIG